MRECQRHTWQIAVSGRTRYYPFTMHIIGITGTLGAGKGTLVEYLETKGYRHVAVSDTFLANEAKKRGLTADRITRRDIANEYRAQGATKLMEAVYNIALPLIDEGKKVVIEPQHTAAEVLFIKSKGGIVFAIDADLNVRYQRIRARGGTKDNVSFEEFSEEQEREMYSSNPNKNNLGDAIACADIKLINNNSLEELHVQIDNALQQL